LCEAEQLPDRKTLFTFFRMPQLSKNERDFFRVATWASTFGFAVLGAILGSLTGTREQFGMQLCAGTFIGAAVAGIVSWGIWTFVRRKAEQSDK
jgi:hypothetical protein